MDATRLWAEIDLSAVAHNLRDVRRRVGPDVDILGTVKANAYGHGAVEIAGELARGGVKMLGVANVAEGVELREAGIRTPILVLGASLPDEVSEAVRHRIALTLSPPEILPEIARHVALTDRPARVHLMLDTGMTRVGVDWSQAVEIARNVAQTPGVTLEGIATHFPLADSEDQTYSRAQLSMLEVLLDDLALEGIRPAIRHAANTSGLAMLDASHLTMVRPGLALYGMLPDASLAGRLQLRPALSLKTRIVYLRDIPAGTPVGYGHTWRAPRDTRIATLPAGYADGYSRECSNRAEVVHRGRRVPVVGKVSMDYITIDLGAGAAAGIGDTVTLIGEEDGVAVTAEEMAAWRGTIPYEVTCSLGTRVRCVHVRRRAGSNSVQV